MGRHQRAIRQRHPKIGRLRAPRPHVLRLRTPALIPGMADRTGVVGSKEGANDKLTTFDAFDGIANFFNDAAVLVSHGRGLLWGIDAPIGPQVRPADAARR